MHKMKYGELPRLVRTALAEYSHFNIHEFAEAEFPYHSYQEINSVVQRLARIGELEKISRGVYKVSALFTHCRSRKRKRKIPQEILEAAIRLYVAGWSEREVAKKLKISRVSVHATLQQAGVKLRNRWEQKRTTQTRSIKLPKQFELDI